MVDFLNSYSLNLKNTISQYKHAYYWFYIFKMRMGSLTQVAEYVESTLDCGSWQRLVTQLLGGQL